MPDIVTRFAPSPTGFLHIGGARTALLNWLYAKRYHGKFLLRIEDTDKKRSTQEAIDAIIDGLKWLEIHYDKDVIYQSQRIKRHIEIANLLIEKGKAYYCYCREDKTTIVAKGQVNRHKCTVSDKNTEPVVRFKIKEESEEIVIDDKVYGQIKVNSAQLDDIIILRSDKTPTYIFAVVVDDYDAGVTHIIRGSDHLTNTFKQFLIYKALDFKVPYFAHVPLIHDVNGNKLSKRHGAASVSDYKKIGILPQAMRNYLLRLGWSHGNIEIINDRQAREWFNLENIGRSPACLDLKKLEHLNNYYINNTNNEDLLKVISVLNNKAVIDDRKKKYLLQGLIELKKRVHYLTELPNLARFYIEDVPLHLSEEASQTISSTLDLIDLLAVLLSKIDHANWNNHYLLIQIKGFAKSYNTKMENIYHALRAPITGMTKTPGIIGIMIILGKDECIKRLQYAKHYVNHQT
ncbi:glutamate--tRNA ligase [Wolbachia pipientis]|uniref:Glutamate--tRNA ligase n=1 Tax=Wolbachia pipientis TaxID=955 RepID=A0A1E7QK22_WOLPI|nr:glutamate--tRNA ligase [Wolbachia pipientis]OEY86579.1 glutamate--tRNA ligase [Wolbachia pipientis]